MLLYGSRRGVWAMDQRGVITKLVLLDRELILPDSEILHIWSSILLPEQQYVVGIMGCGSSSKLHWFLTLVQIQHDIPYKSILSRLV